MRIAAATPRDRRGRRQDRGSPTSVSGSPPETSSSSPGSIWSSRSNGLRGARRRQASRARTRPQPGASPPRPGRSRQGRRARRPARLPSARPGRVERSGANGARAAVGHAPAQRPLDRPARAARPRPARRRARAEAARAASTSAAQLLGGATRRRWGCSGSLRHRARPEAGAREPGAHDQARRSSSPSPQCRSCARGRDEPLARLVGEYVVEARTYSAATALVAPAGRCAPRRSAARPTHRAAPRSGEA